MKKSSNACQLFDEVSRDEEKDPYVDSDGKYDKDHKIPSSESEESVSSSNWDVPQYQKNEDCGNKKIVIPEEPNRQNNSGS